MNIIDPILLAILSLFALRGYFKGFFRESFSLAGLLAGFTAAVRYDESVAALLTGYSRISLIFLQAVAFVVLFFAVYFAFSAAGWILHRSVKILFLQPFNRMGGLVVGAGKGTAIVALLVFFLGAFPLLPEAVRRRVNESYLAPPLSQLARDLIETGKSHLLPPGDEREARAGAGAGSRLG